YLVYAPKIGKETEDKEMIYYNSLREIPEYGKKTIEKLIDKGVLQGCGNGNLQISEDMLRILVINHRAGLYD
ncbi:MAG: N-acetylmuramoyl-L-alanine amidase, partial [Clostridiales bacterium]